MLGLVGGLSLAARGRNQCVSKLASRVVAVTPKYILLYRHMWRTVTRLMSITVDTLLTRLSLSRVRRQDEFRVVIEVTLCLCVSLSVEDEISIVESPQPAESVRCT